MCCKRAVGRKVWSAKAGYNLAEIVVVLLVLGVVAAIVVPQFTSAGVATQQQAAKDQLRTIRAAVELYRAQHRDALPDLSENWNALTTRSDVSGQRIGSPLFGPYLPNPPTNPLTHGIHLGTAPEPGLDWCWDSTTGAVTALDQNGSPFVETP